MKIVNVFLLGLAPVSSMPYWNEQLQLLPKVDDILSYQNVTGDSKPVVDLWAKATHLEEAARYMPDTADVYHLFTRHYGAFYLRTSSVPPFSRG